MVAAAAAVAPRRPGARRAAALVAAAAAVAPGRPAARRAAALAASSAAGAAAHGATRRLASRAAPSPTAAEALTSAQLRGTPRGGAPSFVADPAAFRVAAREVGQERGDLPLWALRAGWPAAAALPTLAAARDARPAASRRDVSGVVGCFQLLDVLSAEECNGLVVLLDGLGFHSDAAVSLPYSFRHMTNCNVVVPDEFHDALFERCRSLLPDVVGCPPLGLNAKFRCYRYGPGDYFKPHTDGAWPGTRARDDVIVQDAFGDRLSQLTFLVLLTEDYEGGETRFADGPGDPGGVSVRTPRGGVLCFPHGVHPDSPLHEGKQVSRGWKYMIRTEVLYSLEAVRHLRAGRVSGRAPPGGRL